MVDYFWMDFIPLCCGRIFFLTFCFYLNQVNKNGFRCALHNFSLSIIGDKVSRLYRIRIIYFCSLKNFIVLLVQNRFFFFKQFEIFFVWRTCLYNFWLLRIKGWRFEIMFFFSNHSKIKPKILRYITVPGRNLGSIF